jgi:hypothetical protein
MPKYINIVIEIASINAGVEELRRHCKNFGVIKGWPPPYCFGDIIMI